MTRERPAHRLSTRYPPRAHHHIGSLAPHRFERRQQSRDVVGVVAEVGVHVDSYLEAMLPTELKAF